MTLRNTLLAGTALGAAALFAAPAFAASNTQAELDALKAQVEALQRKIDDVQIQHGNAIKSLEERKSDVIVGLKNGRPSFESADGNFSLEITGRAHLDMGYYDQDDASEANFGGLGNNINFRRAIVGVTGTVWKDFEYDLHFNFGDSGDEKAGDIYEAALHYVGIEGVKLSIGAIQPKLTLDDSTSSNDITFIERATAANLMTGIGAGDGRMAIGGSGNTDNFFAAAYYTMGSVGVGNTTDGDTSNILGRLAFATSPKEGPNFHIGVSGTYAANLPGDSIRFRDRPELRVDATRMIDTTALTADSAMAYGPELAFNYGPFRAQGEYYIYSIDGLAGSPDADFSAYYLQASWILTGESYKYSMSKAAYSGVSPDNPFMPGGGAGAWEIAARYSSADLNDSSLPAADQGGEQDIYTVGLNWYPNKNVRFMLNYLHVDVEDRGSIAIPDFSHDAIALRTQFTF